MSDYTPTTDQMRECATSSWDIAWLTPEVFDRWLAAEKAKWEQEVLEKAVERIWNCEQDMMPYLNDQPTSPRLNGMLVAFQIARDAAIRGEGESDE